MDKGYYLTEISKRSCNTEYLNMVKQDHYRLQARQSIYPEFIAHDIPKYVRAKTHGT